MEFVTDLSGVEFSRNEKGRCVLANKAFAEGEIIFNEKPFISISDYEAEEELCNGPILNCCFCHRPLCSLQYQIDGLFKQQHQECSIVDNLTSLDLPFLSSKADALLSPIVECGCCNERYCSIECREGALNQTHKWMCSERVPGIEAFKNHARETNTTFLFAGKICVMILLSYVDEIKYKDAKVVPNEDEKDSVQIDRLFEKLCFMNYEEIVPIPEDITSKSYEAEFRQQVREEIQESCNLLRSALLPLIPKDTSFQEKFNSVLSYNFFSRVCGVISMNSHCVVHVNTAIVNDYFALILSVLSSGMSNPSSEDMNALEKLKRFLSTVCGIEHQTDASTLFGTAIESLEGTSGSGIFSNISCLNHSCEPNASVEYLSENDTATLVALKPIEKGEELFISYIDLEDADITTRKRDLSEYMFSCVCQKCSRELHEQQ